MRLRTTTAASLVALSAVGGVIALASPAAADLVTSCNGVGGAVTVPGDLVVPAGKSCTLTGTTVEGAVTVRAGADLIATDAVFKGKVTVQENGYLDVTDTEIGGTVTARSAFGAYLDGGQVSGDLRATAISGSEVEGFLFAVGSEVDGALNARTGDLFVESATIGGSATGDGTGYADLHDTVVEGNLRIAGNEHGSVFCGGEVYGNATYLANSGIVQIGSDGPGSSCAATSYWDRNVTVKDNTATVHIDHNIIRGDLVATGNDPVALTGAHNRVRGDVEGEFGEIVATRSRVAAAQDRAAELEAKAEDRREAARTEAQQAGEAF
ncbi:hypothetical protein ACQEU5_15850 [Marinactinospora thermotolerans]|uniref:Polymer-forming protein n=1 Tax=Marinactinospora thermotolerans DSM 45154 TaxID=1122192 RepID=A0A1T4SNI9_9ACTN|nr:hypothetical protein [Marinactinospora thermotolerans]SKA29810.1 hypothetical protein SAMN02745673_03775 [Marinactinospora thermotolerans DSM 45154]